MHTHIQDDCAHDKSEQSKIFPREFIAQEAQKHGFTYAQILSHERQKELVDVRWEIARSLRARGMSFARIGRIMNRDHSSIIHAVRS